MIIRSMFLCTKSVTPQIKGKLLWMLPGRKDISISVIPDLEWPPLAVRKHRDVEYVKMDTRLILLKTTRGTENEPERQERFKEMFQ